MGSMSIYHWVILGIVVLVLFGGGGKISSLMGDFAKGIKSFKKSMAEDDSPAVPTVAPPSVEHTRPVPASTPASTQLSASAQHFEAQQPDASMVEDDHNRPHS